MLCLTRCFGERVMLTLPGGAQIVVTVLERSLQGWVRLGFEAPADVVIAREELLARKDEGAKKDGGGS